MKSGELLAPAGSRTAAVAAIAAGADAIYLGGRKFGARAFAENFSDEDLADLIRYAHLRGVSVYVTVNTLVFDDEFDQLLAYSDFLVAHDVDALIVQDLGVLDIFLQRYPDTPIHASTQMNIHLPEQAKVLADLGVRRIILARETSIETIKDIRRMTNVELEVFVHGAICVSYSGNCLFSALVAGRSGNRGECAQLCRLPYTLLKDGEPISDEAYLMSPKDLMTLPRLSELIDAGVVSFKIEGRMRKPEYVAQTVSSYRKALSAITGGPTIDIAGETDRLRRVFNREYTEGYLFDTPPNAINNAYRPNHMGVQVGTVTAFERGKATILLTDLLAVNDGIRFLGKTDTGNVVSRILSEGKLVTRAFSGETIQIDSAEVVEVGAKVMKTLDHDLEEELASFADENAKTIGLVGHATAYVGQPFRLVVTDAEGRSAEATTEFIIPRAENRPMSAPEIEVQVAKLGNTPFFWSSLKIDTDGHGFIPVKALNETRRTALERLGALRVLPRRANRIHTDRVMAPAGFVPRPFEIIAKVRTVDQLEAAVASGLKTIAYEETLVIDPTSYRSVHLVSEKQRIRRNGAPFTSSDDAYASELSAFGQSFRGDLFFNVVNRHSVHFLARHGARSVMLSPELGQDRVRALVEGYRSTYHEEPALEIVAYGRAELMISKYCPIAKNKGANPGCTLCARNQYALRDRMGYEFPLVNDGNCNIRVLNSRTLHLADFADFLRTLGISLRLDFTIESAAETRGVIAAFQKAIAKQSYVVDRQQSTYGRFVR